MGDRYIGVVDAVVEESVKNLYKRGEDGKPIESLEPVVCFRDGWRWIPNLGARRALIDCLGQETDEWVGRRLVVSRHRVKGSGKWEKHVACADTEEQPGSVTPDDELEVGPDWAADHDEQCIEREVVLGGDADE